MTHFLEDRKIREITKVVTDIMTYIDHPEGFKYDFDIPKLSQLTSALIRSIALYHIEKNGNDFEFQNLKEMMIYKTSDLQKKTGIRSYKFREMVTGLCEKGILVAGFAADEVGSKSLALSDEFMRSAEAFSDSKYTPSSFKAEDGWDDEYARG